MSVNLNEIFDVIITNINAWLPTVTAVLSMVICIFVGIARVKRAANDLKSDQTIKELKAEVEQEIATNKETQRLNKYIINRMLKLYDTEEKNDEKSGET